MHDDDRPCPPDRLSVAPPRAQEKSPERDNSLRALLHLEDQLYGDRLLGVRAWRVDVRDLSEHVRGVLVTTVPEWIVLAILAGLVAPPAGCEMEPLSVACTPVVAAAAPGRGARLLATSGGWFVPDVVDADLGVEPLEGEDVPVHLFLTPAWSAARAQETTQ